MSIAEGMDNNEGPQVKRRVVVTKRPVETGYGRDTAGQSVEVGVRRVHMKRSDHWYA